MIRIVVQLKIIIIRKTFEINIMDKSIMSSNSKAIKLNNNTNYQLAKIFLATAMKRSCLIA